MIFVKYRVDLYNKCPQPITDPIEIVIDRLVVSGSCYYESVVPPFPPNTTYPPRYNFGENDKAYLDAYKFLLGHFNTMFPSLGLIPPPGNNYNCGYRLVNQKKSTCSKEIITLGGHHEVTFCNSQSCCKIISRVCNDGEENNVLRPQKYDFLFRLDERPPAHIHPCAPFEINECKASCFENINDIILPKKNESEINFQENNLTIKTTNESVNIEINNIELKNLNLQIISILGQSIVNETDKINNNFYQKSIDVSNYINGSYYLVLLEENVVKFSSKFIINK